jgi:hypothetical protein
MYTDYSTCKKNISKTREEKKREKKWVPSAKKS